MTDSRDLEARLRRTLHAVAPVAAPDLADRLLRETARTPQRRSWLRGLAIPTLSMAGVAAVAIVIGLQLGGLVRGPESSMGVAPSGAASPSPVPSVMTTPSGAPGMTPCQNPDDGYTVDYPSDWFANPLVPAPEGLDPIAPCRFFAEDAFEVRPNAGLPSSVAISFQVVPEIRPPGGTVQGGEASTTVDGHAATVREVETGEGAFMPAGTLVYEYFIELADGGYLLVSTDSSRDGDYVMHRDVLDRMVETLRFG